MIKTDAGETQRGSHALTSTCGQTSYQNKEQRGWDYNTHRGSVTPFSAQVVITTLYLCWHLVGLNVVYYTFKYLPCGGLKLYNVNWSCKGMAKVSSMVAMALSWTCASSRFGAHRILHSVIMSSQVMPYLTYLVLGCVVPKRPSMKWDTSFVS